MVFRLSTKYSTPPTFIFIPFSESDESRIDLTIPSPNNSAKLDQADTDRSRSPRQDDSMNLILMYSRFSNHHPRCYQGISNSPTG